MAKMKEDYVKTKEREEFLKDEIEMLKKKLHNQENLASKTSSPGYLKHNKGKLFLKLCLELSILKNLNSRES